MLSVGIHIKKDSVHLVGLSIEGSKPKIQWTEEHFFTDQKEKQEKALFISQFIEKIQENNKGEALRFCYGLSQNIVTSFFVQLPFKEKFKIIKTLPFEIEDQSPFQSNKVFFDARICKIKNQKESQSICFVTPEENVEKFIDFSRHLCQKPYLLSCSASALANVLEPWNKPLSQNQNPNSHPFYLYLGTENSQLLFYREGHLEHISFLDWSLSSIVKDMEKFYKLTRAKAWEEFFEKSFILTSEKGFSKEQVFFSHLIKKKLQPLLNQIRLLKMSFETEKKVALENLALLGPGSVIKNLSAFLTAETSMNFFKLRSLKLFPHLDLQEKSDALIPLGLALEGLKRAPYEGVNFLKSTNKEPLSLFPKTWQKKALLSFLVFLLLTAYAFIRKQESYKIFEKIQPVFVHYGKRIAFMKEREVKVKKVQSFLKKEKSKIQDEQFVREKLALTNPMDTIQLFSQKLGTAEKWNLNIAYLKVENHKIQIRGSLNKSSLKSFKSQLEALAKKPLKESPLKRVLPEKNPSLKPLELKNPKDQQKKEKGSGGLPTLSLNKPKEQNTNQIKDKKKENLAKSLQASSSETEEQAFFNYTFEIKEGL